MKPNEKPTTKKSKRGNWLTTIPVVVLGIAYLYFWFLPNRHEIDLMRTDLETQRAIAAQETTLRIEVANKNERLAVAEQYVNQWETVDPDEEHVALLFGEISDVLANAGCQTTKFLPQQHVRMAHLRQVPLELSVNSDLNSLFEALREIEQLPANVSVSRLLIEKPQTGSSLRSEASLVVFSENPKSSD